MFQKLEQSSGSVVGVRISGTLTEEDYQHLVPEFERVIAEHGEPTVREASQHEIRRPEA